MTRAPTAQAPADHALDRALAGIPAHLDDAIADLARMIAVDTSFPPGAGYPAFVQLAEELVAPLGFSCNRHAVPEPLWHVAGGPARGERLNLIAGRRTGKPVCGLYFHMDTVPAAADWVRPPFRLTREGDRLYGLGAADMKGTVAAVLMALRAARSCAVPLAYDPVLLFCTDEEGGLYPGVRYLAEQGLLEGHIVNFNGGAAPRIWAGCFGVFNLLLRVRGRTAHAGDAGAAVNAIEGALPILTALQALKPAVAQRISALPPPPHRHGQPLAASLSLVAAHGGSSGGQVPASFEVLINRRYAPEESFEAALAEIEQVIAAATPQGIGIETALIGHLIPTGDPTGPHWPRWQRALSLGFGFAAQEFRKWGASTCSDFGYVQRTGIREVLLGGLARPERNIHAAEEHTTGEDLIALARSVLAYLAAGFLPDEIPELSAAPPPQQAIRSAS
ncbi:MAG: M20/M25/M40 family metallo-hydrolase [Rhodospirillales bacterium]|nr:M20/M25/M40 family metallo-hydrolase [Rhodospirillales bacterium]